MFGLRILFFLGFLFLLAIPLLAWGGADATGHAREFIKTHESTVRPLEIKAALAWWDANISGKDKDFERKKQAQNALDEVLSNRDTFRELKAIKEGAAIEDSRVARSIEVLYLQYLEKQVDPALLKKMVDLSNNVEKAFNVFRAVVNNQQLNDNDV